MLRRQKKNPRLRKSENGIASATSPSIRRLKRNLSSGIDRSESIVVDRADDTKVYRNSSYALELVLDALRKHKEIQNTEAPELIKATSKSKLTRYPLPNGGPERIYVKEFSNSGVIRWLETALYAHRGKRAWNVARILTAAGVPCPQPIALAEEKKFGLPHKSYLLMKEIAGADKLDDYLVKRFFRVTHPLTFEEIARKRSLIQVGALALRRFHEEHIYHKDMSAKNLLVKANQSGELQFYCVDLDAISFPRRLSLRRRIKNLAQLNGLPGCVTTADRIRFYKAYFNVQKLTAKDKSAIGLIRRLSRGRLESFQRLDERLREKLLLEENR